MNSPLRSPSSIRSPLNKRSPARMSPSAARSPLKLAMGMSPKNSPKTKAPEGGLSSSVLSAAFQDKIMRDFKLAGSPKAASPHAVPVDPAKAKLTLAQRVGIEEKPPAPLSLSEWEKVREKSAQRADSQMPCAICQEDFKLEDQVLLSCSHVFHKACLQSFERFSGIRSCPLCRASDYQKKVINDGADAYRSRCATRIQAHWRGYRTRKAYRQMQEQCPPKDPAVRKKFLMNKLERATDKMLSALEESDANIDSLLSQMDKDLEASRQTFKSVEVAMETKSEDSWELTKKQALERGDTDCPICMCALQGKTQVLLSCSHVFHEVCIASFEKFMFLDSSQSPKCPLCRTFYTKKPL